MNSTVPSGSAVAECSLRDALSSPALHQRSSTDGLEAHHRRRVDLVGWLATRHQHRAASERRGRQPRQAERQRALGRRPWGPLIALHQVGGAVVVARPAP